MVVGSEAPNRVPKTGSEVSLQLRKVSKDSHLDPADKRSLVGKGLCIELVGTYGNLWLLATGLRTLLLVSLIGFIYVSRTIIRPAINSWHA